jgi:hypothetical protein
MMGEGVLRTVKSCGPGAPMQAPSLAMRAAESNRTVMRPGMQGDGGKGWFTEESAYKP